MNLSAEIARAEDTGYRSGRTHAKSYIEARQAASAEALEAIRGRLDLSDSQKLKLIKKRHRLFKREIDAELVVINKKLSGLEKEKTALYAKQAATEEILQWIRGPLNLERAVGSQLHQLQNDYDAGRLVQRREDDPCLVECLNESYAFVVEHNWGNAFKGATDFESEAFRLPFDASCFEFVISARRVVAFATHTSDDPASEIVLKPILKTKNGWFEADYVYRYQSSRWQPVRPSNSSDDLFTGLIDLIGAQIKAISVALEAEVAVSDVVRAPHKLINARLRDGKYPPLDYHVVSLSRRQRAEPLEESCGTGTKKRLHFRRGHWRHFETHRTWVRWCLVGEPNLGFIDKHYRL